MDVRVHRASHSVESQERGVFFSSDAVIPESPSFNQFGRPPPSVPCFSSLQPKLTPTTFLASSLRLIKDRLNNPIPADALSRYRTSLRFFVYSAAVACASFFWMILGAGFVFHDVHLKTKIILLYEVSRPRPGPPLLFPVLSTDGARDGRRGSWAVRRRKTFRLSFPGVRRG